MAALTASQGGAGSLGDFLSPPGPWRLLREEPRLLSEHPPNSPQPQAKTPLVPQHRAPCRAKLHRYTRRHPSHCRRMPSPSQQLINPSAQAELISTGAAQSCSGCPAQPPFPVESKVNARGHSAPALAPPRLPWALRPVPLVGLSYRLVVLFSKLIL